MFLDDFVKPAYSIGPLDVGLLLHKETNPLILSLFILGFLLGAAKSNPT